MLYTRMYKCVIAFRYMILGYIIEEKSRREKKKTQKKEDTGARNVVFSNDLWVGRVEK